MADVRRLNVACTRARRHLCLIADSSTTSKASNGLVEYMEKVGELRSAHEYLQEIEKVAVPEVGTPIDVPREKTGKVGSSAKPANVEMSKIDKEQVTSRLTSQLDAWSTSTDCTSGKPKEFPSSLTAFERSIVHEWAEKHGFQHRSVGEKKSRRIIVQKTEPVKTASPEPKPLLDAASTEKGNETNDGVPADNEEILSELSVPSGEPSSELTKHAVDILPVSSESRKKKPTYQASSSQVSNKSKGATKTNDNTKNGSSAPGNDLVECDQCGKQLPSTNLSLHALRCTGPSTQSVRPKQKPNVKPLPSVIPASEAKKQPEEDLDAILREFKKLDTVCNFSTCKTSITVLGQQCNYCRRRFCLSHHLPEIHGCGDAARQSARSSIQNCAGTCSAAVKSKPLDATKRAHIQRRLDKKLQDMSVKRTGAKEGKGKSK